MSIKHAVLGLIAEEPRHGYAVRAAFEQRLGDFWDLNYGQIYQVLTSLEADGLITGVDEQVGKRPRRTVYAISPKGRDALRSWLAQPVARRSSFRDEFYVRLLLASQYEPALLSSIVALQRKRCDEHLASLVEQRESRTGTSVEDAVRSLFREAAILRAEADVKALELCQTVLASRRQISPSESERPRRLRART
jgi:DNA-binding PadR family transcriptional regulator